MANKRISIDPGIRFGKPCIKGTRITVEQILREFAASWSFEEVQQAHPHLSRADIQAALNYAADEMGEPELATQ